MNAVLAAEAAGHLMGLAELSRRSAEGLADQIAEIAAIVLEAVQSNRKLMFCGNGGSAADAQHLATEYVVRFRSAGRPLAAMALTTDTSLLTAAANDLGFTHVFARQVLALGRPGDVLFLHSTSGESPNLLAAADAAREVGVRTIAMLARGGGPLRVAVDLALVVETENGAHAQELHLAVGHAICGIVEQRCRNAQAEDAAAREEENGR